MTNGLIYKTCTKCNQDKPVGDFLKHSGQCKSCRSAYTKDYKNKNREKIRESKRQYRKTDKYKEKKKRYRIRHREEILNKQKVWYQNNIEIRHIKQAEYRIKKGPFKWSKQWYQIYKETNKIKYLELSDKKRKYSKTQSSNLTDRYIISLIRDNYKIKGIIPKELVESWRQHIKVKRLLKKKKDENTKTS